MNNQEQQVVDRRAYESLVSAVRMYLDTDTCVCDEEGECPPDCERCMYCIGWKAMWLAGEYTVSKTLALGTSGPELLSELTEAVEAAEEWLTEFGFDQADTSAQMLVVQLQNVLNKTSNVRRGIEAES